MKVLERGMQKRLFIIMLKIDRGKKLLYDYDHSYKGLFTNYDNKTNMYKICFINAQRK